MPKPFLIAVMGPTASGKTSLAIELALHYQSPVLSFDSRQFYQGADIGTAKPNSEELSKVKHLLISHLPPDADYSVNEFEKDALGLAEQHFLHHQTLIAAGGTGFYLRVLEHGLDVMPDVPAEIREQSRSLYAEKGLEALQNEIRRRDPEYFASCDIHNHVRLLRAYELMLASGQSVSSIRKGKTVNRAFRIIKIMRGDFSAAFREEVYMNIEKRVHAMFAAGLIEEARRLLPYRHCQSMQTVGYRECFDLLDGKLSEKECIEQIIMHTRQYAKRQFTWLKKEKDLLLMPGQSGPEIISQLEDRRGQIMS
jgi:tRNA dimethylallyltransferase